MTIAWRAVSALKTFVTVNFFPLGVVYAVLAAVTVPSPPIVTV